LERITVMGMGPIGTSMGLALKKVGMKNTEVVGYSVNRQTSSAIQKMAAFDLYDTNLESALAGAQLVIIDAPITDMRGLIQSASEYLESEAVVTDTSTAKVRCAAWAKEFLPQNVSYIGGRPILKDLGEDIESSNSQVFRGNQYCVMPGQSADEQAVRTVVSMVEALGAKPYFLDPVEQDSYSAAMDILPVVISAAFVNATTAGDSWQEMHKTAGILFDKQSILSSDDPVDAETKCLTVSDPLVHWIDQMILSLHSIRTQLNEDSDDLVESFITAWEQRARWEADAIRTEKEGPHLPSSGESMASTLLGDRLARRLTNLGDANKRASWKYPRV